MKRILTTLILPALLFTSPVALSQETDTNPADSTATLYPEKIARKKLKMQEGRGNILPFGLLSTGNSPLVLSGLTGARGSGGRMDLVVSTSRNGSSWERMGIVLPQLNLPFVTTSGAGAIYDSIRNQVVFLYCEDPSLRQVEASRNSKKKGKELSLNENNKFCISLGKGGKFSKPKDITKQFDAKRRGHEDFRIEGHGLQFQGICLTRGEHRGRLLFLACVADKTLCSIYSDDHGRTWKIGTGVTVKKVSPNSIGNGMFLCEAEDGSLVSFIGPDGQIAKWICSTDGGENWVEKSSAPGQVAQNPGRWANAYIALNCKDGEGKDSRLLSVATIDKDKGLTHVALSYDWGLTWPHQKTINTALLVTRNTVPVHPVAPGTIGMLTTSDTGPFADNGLGNAGFTTFTISWLTDGKDDGIDEESPAPEAAEKAAE